MELALYDEHRSSAYTIVRGLSTIFATLSFQDVTTSNSTIVADALARNPALSLPPDVDPTVLAGYAAQRKILLEEFQTPNNSVGVLFWDTARAAQVFSLRPFSRGNLTINSTNPLAPPVIDYRTATDPTDFAVIIAIFRKLRELMAAPDMAVLGPVEANPLGEGVQSDEDIIAVIRETLVVSAGHSCCSAPMQPLELGGVIDPEHNVYGVKGLRVADISYFPIMVSAGPTATVYASGEKVSF
jgi:choline dehydrogenase